MHVKGKFAVCMNSSWFCIILVLGTFVANPANGYSFHTLLQQLALLEELKPRNPIIFCHSTALACAFLSGWCSASTTTTGEPSPTNAAEHIAGGDLERKRLPLQNSAKQEAKPCDGHRLQLGPAMCKGAASALRFLYLLICLLCLFHIAFLLPECPHLIRFLCRPLGWLNLGGGEQCRGRLTPAFLAAQPKGYIFRHRGEEFKEDYVVKSMCCVASLSTYYCGKYQGVRLFFCGI